MVTSLLEHERIETTDAKAKEVRRLADRMITLGKRGTLHARRQALSVIRKRDVTAKVFDDLAERFREPSGRLYARAQASATASATPRRCRSSSSWRALRREEERPPARSREEVEDGEEGLAQEDRLSSPWPRAPGSPS